ncbi:HEPN domain-containing protein [Gordonia sp. PS3]|uniref:ApeA N-terminal domain 1-containing protein n=1 Tax=Gordonia sp. PS3 TaxID=3248841 RepID=UPI0035BFD675
MDKKVDETLGGTMGHFWVDLATYNRADTSWQGHAEQQDDYLAIRTIKRPDEGLPQPGSTPMPDAVYGATEVGGTVAYDIRSVPENSVMGGNKISVRSYLARGFVVGVDPSELASAKVVSITANFYGLVMWSGAKGAHIDYDRQPDGRVNTMTYTVRRVTPITAEISDRRTLEIGVSWEASERQFDQFSASTPLTFTITRSRPGTWYELIRPVIAFQDLINLAYDAFVPCVGGSLVPHYRKDVEPSKGALWSNSLMDVPEGVKRASEKSERPAFSLGAIGGAPGVRRWLLLAETHPRAVGPLTSARRFGMTTVEVELMNIAVAIEYWVGACKKESTTRPKWTKVKNKGYAELLAMHVGSAFRKFVGGDECKWARLFWDRYTALKHDPLVSYDSYEVSTLMRSGRILLMCALLNRVAGSKAPTRWICQSTQFYHLGERTRDLMASNPKLFRR